MEARDQKQTGSASLTRSNCSICGKPLEVQVVNLPGLKPRRVAIPCSCEVRAEEIRQEGIRAERSRQEINQAGLNTGRYAKFTLESWEENGNKKPFEWLENLSLRFENWLYLWGQFGTGKTHLAVALAKQVAIEKNWRPGIIRWQEYCSKIQQGWRDNSVQNDWDRARGATVLVIDDIDKTNASEWSLGQLFELIDYRYVQQLPTIITANNSIRGLVEEWGSDTKGSAIISRIAEVSLIVEFSGQDRRIEQALRRANG